MSKLSEKDKSINESDKIILPEFKKERLVVVIKGDCDLLLNKMTAEAEEEIIDKQTGKAKKTKQPINMYQRLISGVHWMDNFESMSDENCEVGPDGKKQPKYTAEAHAELMKTNRIGYDASGIKKGLLEAAVRVLGESKSTIINANLKIIPEKKNLIAINFNGQYDVDESIITNWKGNAFLTYRNVFPEWSMSINVEYLPSNITRDQVIQLFQAMGFSGGIGAHRVGLKGGTNGSFNVVEVKELV